LDDPLVGSYMESDFCLHCCLRHGPEELRRGSEPIPRLSWLVGGGWTGYWRKRKSLL